MIHVWYQGCKRNVRFSKNNKPYVLFKNRKCFIRSDLMSHKCIKRIQVGGWDVQVCGSNGCVFIDENKKYVYKFFYDEDDEEVGDAQYQEEIAGIELLKQKFTPEILAEYTVVQNPSIKVPSDIIENVIAFNALNERKLMLDVSICYRYGGHYTFLASGKGAIPAVEKLMLFCKMMSDNGLINHDIHSENIVLNEGKARMIDYEYVKENNISNVIESQKLRSIMIRFFPDYETEISTLGENEMMLLQAIYSIDKEYEPKFLKEFISSSSIKSLSQQFKKLNKP